MIHEVRPNELLLWLYLSCGFGGIAFISVLLAGAYRGQKQSHIATQRARYAWTALAVPIAAVALYLPLHKYSIADCVSTLGEGRDNDFVFGSFITIAFFGMLASPVVSFLAGLWIYFKPATYARRWKGRYILTSEARLRRMSRRRFRNSLSPRRF